MGTGREVDVGWGVGERWMEGGDWERGGWRVETGREVDGVWGVGERRVEGGDWERGGWRVETGREVGGGWGLGERRVEGVKTGKMSGDESDPEAKPGENKKGS